MSGCGDNKKCCGASCCADPCTCGQSCECTTKLATKKEASGGSSAGQVHSEGHTGACKCGANCACNPCNCTEEDSSKSVT